MLCEVLSLVTPCSYALALGLGLVFSKVCIPLTTRCLRAPLLYSAGLVVLRDHTNHACGVAATIYQREQAHGVLVGSLIVKTAGSSMGEACQNAYWRLTCAWGRPEAIHGVTGPGTWPLRGIPCEGLQRGLGGSLRAFRYLGKNTGVVYGVCISTSSLASAYILQSLLCALHFLA
jgi:hypothetical protein